MAIRVLDDKHLEIEPLFMSPAARYGPLRPASLKCEAGTLMTRPSNQVQPLPLPLPQFRCLEWQCCRSNSIDVWQRPCCCCGLGLTASIRRYCPPRRPSCRATAACPHTTIATPPPPRPRPMAHTRRLPLERSHCAHWSARGSS